MCVKNDDRDTALMVLDKPVASVAFADVGGTAFSANMSFVEAADGSLTWTPPANLPHNLYGMIETNMRQRERLAKTRVRLAAKLEARKRAILSKK